MTAFPQSARPARAPDGAANTGADVIAIDSRRPVHRRADLAVDAVSPPSATAETRRLSPLLVGYYTVLGSTTLLTALGLVMVASSSAVTSLAEGESPYAKFYTQALYAAIGATLAFVLSRVKSSWWRPLGWVALVAGLGMQSLVFTPLGRSQGGNTNWIRVFGQSIQPSEFLKLALVVWLGAVLSAKHHQLTRVSHVLLPVIPVTVVSVGLVMAGHDLGTAIILILLVAGALFIAGVPLRMFFTAALAAGAVVALFALSSDNRLGRLETWLNPSTCDPTADCYQPIHGAYALASGGVFGLGLGNSREKWSYLPAAHNDYIFAILGEELGLIGTLLVLVVLGILAFGLFQIVRHHRDKLAQIAAGAVACWIIGQAIINLAVVTGLLPVLGVPLPLLSAGGSALIATLGAIGVVLGLVRSDPDVGAVLRARPSVARKTFAVVSGPARRMLDGRRG